MLQQLEKNQGILPSMRDEAFFRCGFSREISPSLLSLESVLDTLEATLKFPNITDSTREEKRGSCQNSRRALVFPPHLERSARFPVLSGKESQRSCLTSRAGGLNLTLKRNSRGRATILKALMSQCIPYSPDSCALTRRSSRSSTQNTMACVTALWHLERKPPIPY